MAEETSNTGSVESSVQHVDVATSVDSGSGVVDAGLALRGVEEVSIEDLTGVSDEPAESKTETTDKAETSTESKPASSESSEEGTTETGDSTKEETKALAKVDSPTKEHPLGYVPVAAVREAREKNRSLEDQIAQLTQQIATLQTTPPGPAQETADPVDEFKVLDKAAFDELRETDPEAALDYMYQLDLYRTKQFENREREQQARREQAESQRVVDAARGRMDKALPNLISDEGAVDADFIKFAEDIGFTPELLALTRPDTVVLLPGADAPQLLGDRAAEMYEMLSSMKSKVSERGAYRDTIRKELRAEIEAELLEKFKTEGSEAFQSIRDVKGGGDPTIGTNITGVLSGADFDKLTPEQQRLYLSGA